MKTAQGVNQQNENNEHHFWSEIKHRLMAETNLDIFKTWDTVLRIPIYWPEESFEHYCPEVEALLPSPSNLWKKVLKEPFLGHTSESYSAVQRFSYNGAVECTPWTFKSAHHILTFQKIRGRDISSYKQIVDFGAGIGETARMILDLGFQGDYYIYDLPQTSRISGFYLKDYPNIKIVDNYDQIPNNNDTLFIGTWSLSEVPYLYRNEIARHFVGHDFLIIFQTKGFEYDNLSYFLMDFPRETDTFIKLERIAWHAGGSYYLVGTKVSS